MDWTFKDDNEWNDKMDIFEKMYPDFPFPKPLEKLNLVMRKVNAEEIIRGEKTVEFRACSDHFMSRLFDNDTLKWFDAHADDNEVNSAIESGLLAPGALREVHTIHYHNYGNTWFLDVSLKDNGMMPVSDEAIKTMQEKFGSHELDKALAKLNAQKLKLELRPSLFYFAIDKVLDTDLKK